MISKQLTGFYVVTSQRFPGALWRRLERHLSSAKLAWLIERIKVLQTLVWASCEERLMKMP